MLSDLIQDMIAINEEAELNQEQEKRLKEAQTANKSIFFTEGAQLQLNNIIKRIDEFNKLNECSDIELSKMLILKNIVNLTIPEQKLDVKQPQRVIPETEAGQKELNDMIYEWQFIAQDFYNSEYNRQIVKKDLAIINCCFSNIENYLNSLALPRAVSSEQYNKALKNARVSLSRVVDEAIKDTERLTRLTKQALAHSKPNTAKKIQLAYSSYMNYRVNMTLNEQTAETLNYKSQEERTLEAISDRAQYIFDLPKLRNVIKQYLETKRPEQNDIMLNEILKLDDRQLQHILVMSNSKLITDYYYIPPFELTDEELEYIADSIQTAQATKSNRLQRELTRDSEFVQKINIVAHFDAFKSAYPELYKSLIELLELITQEKAEELKASSIQGFKCAYIAIAQSLAEVKTIRPFAISELSFKDPMNISFKTIKKTNIISKAKIAMKEFSKAKHTLEDIAIKIKLYCSKYKLDFDELLLDELYQLNEIILSFKNYRDQLAGSLFGSSIYSNTLLDTLELTAQLDTLDLTGA